MILFLASIDLLDGVVDVAVMFSAIFTPIISPFTLPTAEILSGKNARAWVSMVLYVEK
jgi:hypothetical protein